MIDGNPPEDDSQLADRLGRLVRDVWCEWAAGQPFPKASWLVPWEGLSESDKEPDRRIGLVLYEAGRAAERASERPAAVPDVGPGPPLPWPLGACSGCLTGTCACSPRTRQSGVHGGGYVPAVTVFEGTALCQDCALAAARGIREWHQPD